MLKRRRKSKPLREPVKVGKFGITVTRKEPGDFVWNVRKQTYEQVPA